MAESKHKVYTKTCPACGETFQTKRADKRTCSTYCSRQRSTPEQGWQPFNRGRPV